VVVVPDPNPNFVVTKILTLCPAVDMEAREVKEERVARAARVDTTVVLPVDTMASSMMLSVLLMMISMISVLVSMVTTEAMEEREAKEVKVERVDTTVVSPSMKLLSFVKLITIGMKCTLVDFKIMLGDSDVTRADGITTPTVTPTADTVTITWADITITDTTLVEEQDMIMDTVPVEVVLTITDTTRVTLNLHLTILLFNLHLSTILLLFLVVIPLLIVTESTVASNNHHKKIATKSVPPVVHPVAATEAREDTTAVASITDMHPVKQSVNLSTNPFPITDRLLSVRNYDFCWYSISLLKWRCLLQYQLMIMKMLRIDIISCSLDE